MYIVIKKVPTSNIDSATFIDLCLVFSMKNTSFFMKQWLHTNIISKKGEISTASSRYTRLAGSANLAIKRYRVSLPNLSASYHKNKVTVRNNYLNVKYR